MYDTVSTPHWAANQPCLYTYNHIKSVKRQCRKENCRTKNVSNAPMRHFVQENIMIICP